MRKFHFPAGVWVLREPRTQEVTAVNIGLGRAAVALFSDEDLAERFARDAGLTGRVPEDVAGRVAEFLRQAKAMGATHMATDPTYGRGVFAKDIDEAIRDAEEQERAEQAPQAHDPDDD